MKCLIWEFCIAHLVIPLNMLWACKLLITSNFLLPFFSSFGFPFDHVCFSAWGFLVNFICMLSLGEHLSPLGFKSPSLPTAGKSMLSSLTLLSWGPATCLLSLPEWWVGSLPSAPPYPFSAAPPCWDLYALRHTAPSAWWEAHGRSEEKRMRAEYVFQGPVSEASLGSWQVTFSKQLFLIKLETVRFW